MKTFFEFVRESLLIMLLSAFFAVIFTFPSVTRLSSSYIGDGGDNYEYASYMGLASQNISNGLWPFSTTTFWRYPVGFDFSRGFDSYLTVGTGTILASFTSLITSYNLVILMLMTLNGICSYFFFKILTNSKILAILGMLIYGFSFYTLAKAASHPNLLFIGGFPLLGIAIFNFLKSPVIKLQTILLFFTTLFLISLGSMQYFVFAVIFILLYLILLFITDNLLFRELWHKFYAKRLQFILGFSLYFCTLILFFFPHITAFLRGDLVLLNRAGILHDLTPSLSDYIFPNKYLTILPSKLITSESLPSIEKIVYFGWIETLFAFFFFLRRSILVKQKIIVGLLFAIPFLLSLGYGKDNSFFLLPYNFISSIFPFSLIVETGRFVVIFGLILTVAVLLFIKSFKSKKVSLVVAMILFIGTFLERVPTEFYKSSTFNENYTSVVKAQKSKAVLDIPINYYYSPYNILSLHYDKPIVNGYFHWSADSYRERSFIESSSLNKFICDHTKKPDILQNEEAERIRKDLKENGITTLVVHKDYKFLFPECDNVRFILNTLMPPVAIIAPTPLTEERELVLRSITGIPQFNLHFPNSGTFYIGGMYIAPSNPVNFQITKNKIPVNFSYSFVLSPDYSMEIEPKHTIQLPVEAGDKLTIQGDYISNQTHFSLWYRFIPSENSSTVTYTHKFNKIHEDDLSIIINVE